MAVLSFKHLKNPSGGKINPSDEKINPSDEKQHDEKSQADFVALDVSRLVVSTPDPNFSNAQNGKNNLLSFSHLKNRTGRISENVEANVDIKKSSNLPLERKRTSYGIPAVMESALLVAVNYCHGCGRFLAAGENEINNSYGRCLRDAPQESEYSEVYKIIPKNAKVGRCYYFIKNRKQVII